jgi:hypothetical protein
MQASYCPFQPKQAMGRAICALLLMAAMPLINSAHAGIVDNMLQDHVPYIDWRSNDPYIIGVNLARNPGYWHHETGPNGFYKDTWVGGNAADGDGGQVRPDLDPSKIPPYTTLSHWFQRDSGVIMSQPANISFLSFYPGEDYVFTRDKAENSGHAISANIDISSIHLSVGGFAAKIGSDWVYRYTIANTGTETQSVEFILSEFFNHAGFHHEFNFVNDGGIFVYDDQPFGAVRSHNYDWTGMSIAAGSSVQIGFSDIHGPAFDTWAIKTASGTYGSETDLLPVPSPVPEPTSLVLILAGVAVLFGARQRLQAASCRRYMMPRQTGE